MMCEVGHVGEERGKGKGRWTREWVGVGVWYASGMTPPGVKEELHELIDAMDAGTAVRLLAMISLLDDPDGLDDEEAEAVRVARREFEAGDFVTGEALRREFDRGR